jgi:hypothetical protein
MGTCYKTPHFIRIFEEVGNFSFPVEQIEIECSYTDELCARITFVVNSRETKTTFIEDFQLKIISQEDVESEADNFSALDFTKAIEQKLFTIEPGEFAGSTIKKVDANSRSFAKTLPTAMKLVCGDAETVERKVNGLLSCGEWEISGEIIWDGKLFWQKMVQY